MQAFNHTLTRPPLLIAQNQQAIRAICASQDALSNVITQIGGLDDEKTGDLAESVLKAKAKIARLKVTTKQAWSTSPESLREKMTRLAGLERTLEEVQRVSDRSFMHAGDEQSIYLPKRPLASGNVLGDTLQILAHYNALPTDTKNTIRIVSNPHSYSDNVDKMNLAISDLEGNWSFQKFNRKDCRFYETLTQEPLSLEEKHILSAQIITIDKKIDELKKNKAVNVPELHARLYKPEVMGQILALETAKFRRSVLIDPLKNEIKHEYLKNPQFFVQTGETPLLIKIDNQFWPTDTEIAEMIELNKAYKPILERLFPQPININLLPGHEETVDGFVGKGFNFARNPEQGVWISSCDFAPLAAEHNSSYRYKATEYGIENYLPSAIESSTDRSRVLAHELGHIVAFRQIQLDSDQASPGKLITDINEMKFFEIWKGLRVESKAFAGKGKIFTPLHNMLSPLGIAYEMVAEDIRIAVTGDKVSASSRISGIFDQTAEGRPHFEKTIAFLQDFLIARKPILECLMKHM